MHETGDDLARLQAVLDRSFEGSGEHLRSAFDQENRLSAEALVEALPGIFEMHLAVTAADGSPLVAPVDGFFLRGNVCVGLPAKSVRARRVRRDPRASASFVGDSASFIVHGTLLEVREGHPLVDLFDVTTRRLYAEQYGGWFNDWLDHKQATEGRGFTGFVEPRVMFAKN